MEPDHADQDSGNEEDVHREESGQRAPRDDRTAEQHLNERVADTRGTRCDRRPDPEPPVRVLIPPEYLAREGHAERAQEQEHADDPRELTRVFVGAKQKDLIMCNVMIATIALEPQKWTARRNQPNVA